MSSLGNVTSGAPDGSRASVSVSKSVSLNRKLEGVLPANGA
jgi:hypothetical protein